MNLKVRKYVIIIFLITLTFSCKKDSSGISINSKLIQKKWNLPTPNSLNFKWIEFTNNNNYIIQFLDNTSKSSSYEISQDNKKIILNNLGTIKVNMLTDNVFDFNLTNTGSNNSINGRGTPGTYLGNSTNTNLICQYWYLKKGYEYNDSTRLFDTIFYPKTNPNSQGLIRLNEFYTNYGTYMVIRLLKYQNNYDVSYYTLNWRWKNEDETEIEYYYDVRDSETARRNVRVLKLSANEFIFKEDLGTYFFNR